MSVKPTKPTLDSKLEEIMWAHSDIGEAGGGLSAIPAIKALIAEEVEAVIGEDENSKGLAQVESNIPTFRQIAVRNNLRAHQRTVAQLRLKENEQ